MSLIQEQKVQTHKASDLLIHATEKQCSFVRSMEVDGKKEYCALGILALYSSGDPLSDNTYIEEKFNVGLDETASCPACDFTASRGSIIVHLNNKSDICMNNHDWTFKQIGQWLKEEGR